LDKVAVENFSTAGRIASKILKEALKEAREGTDLLDLANYVDERIAQEGGKPAFPVNLSINHVAAHFTPVSKGDLLKVGDMLKIDLGVHVDGYLADTASTIQVGVGTKHPMIAASKDALAKGLEHVIPNGEVERVGSVVSSTISSRGFKVIENLTGHLMKKNKLHAGLSVPNIPEASGETFPKEGAVAIEPFATDGAGHVVAGKNGNIYLFVREGRLKIPSHKNSARYLKDNHPYFPFTPRWISLPDFSSDLMALERKGAVRAYPVLNEASGGTVTQHEHTVLLYDGKAVVTTV